MEHLHNGRILCSCLKKKRERKEALNDLTWKDCQDVLSQTSKMQNRALNTLVTIWMKKGVIGL